MRRKPNKQKAWRLGAERINAARRAGKRVAGTISGSARNLKTLATAVGAAYRQHCTYP